MKRIKSVLIHVFAMLLLFSLCSCSKDNPQNNTQEEQTVPDFEPLTDIVEGRDDIYLIIKVLNSNYWDTIVKGAKDAGEKFNCNVYYSGTYKETDWKIQEMLLDKCVSLGADAIILSPDDSIGLSAKIEEIHSKNIPIVLVDTAAITDGYDVCYMTDNLYAGNIAADEMLNQLYKAGFSENEELSVGILVGQSSSQTINERLAGFYQYWITHAPSKWTIISDIKNCNGDISLGDKYVNSLIAENENLHGLYATNNGPTKVIAKSVLANNSKDIVVVGFDYSDEIKQLIETPEYHASTILQRQYQMSYNGVETALKLINGYKNDVKFEDTGVVIVNIDNLEDPEVKSVIDTN